MATQEIGSKKSPIEKMKNFYTTNHLDEWMGRIYKWNQKGCLGKIKAHTGNFGVLGMDLAGIGLNILKAPVMVAAQPVTLAVNTGATVTKNILHLTKLDGPEAKHRRKIMQVLPKASNFFPSILDLGRTILKVAKYALAFLSSLTIGFISVTANIWVHHKLGLICNPEFAKQDRKNEIINSAKNTEKQSLSTTYDEMGKNRSLKNAYKEIEGRSYRNIYKKQIDERAEKILKKQIFGNNQYDIQIEPGFISSMIQKWTQEVHGSDTHWDENTIERVIKNVPRRQIVIDKNSLYRNALEQATQNKREASKAALEKEQKRELTPEELEQIQAKFWKPLKEPFSFSIDKDTPQHYQDFLNEFFNWKHYEIIDLRGNRQFKKYLPQPFAFKTKAHYERYMAEYNKWNLTLEDIHYREIEVKGGGLRPTLMKSPITITNEQVLAAYIQAEKELVAERRKNQRSIVKKEVECADFDRRVTQALHDKQVEFKNKMTQEIQALTKQTKARIAAEKEIIKATENLDKNLSSEEVDAIINKESPNCSEEERKELQNFALMGVDIIENRMEAQRIDWDQRLNKVREEKKEELKRNHSEELASINDKVKAIIQIEKAILDETQESGQNLSEEDVNEIIEENEADLRDKFEKGLLTRLTEFTETERQELRNFSKRGLEIKEEKEKELLKITKRRPGYLPAEHYYGLKNMVIRQIQREESHRQNPLQREVAEPINIDEMVREEELLREKAARQKNEEPQPIAQETLELMKKHYEEIEKPRLIQKQLLDEKPTIQKSEDGNAFYFKTLEEARNLAFEKFNKNFYVTNEDGSKKAREWIETKASRKDNEDNLPIDKKTKPLNNKDWASVRLKLPEDDDLGETKIIIQGQKRVRNDNGTYSDGEFTAQELTFNDLDLIAVRANNWKKSNNLHILNNTGKVKKFINRSEVFRAAAKKYKSVESRIHEKHLGPRGVEEIVARHQKKQIKLQNDDHALWQIFGDSDQTTQDEELKRQKAINQILQARLAEAEAYINGTAIFDEDDSVETSSPKTLSRVPENKETPKETSTQPPKEVEVSSEEQNKQATPTTPPTTQPPEGIPPSQTSQEKTATPPPEKIGTPEQNKESTPPLKQADTTTPSEAKKEETQPPAKVENPDSQAEKQASVPGNETSKQDENKAA